MAAVALHALAAGGRVSAARAAGPAHAHAARRAHRHAVQRRRGAPGGARHLLPAARVSIALSRYGPSLCYFCSPGTPGVIDLEVAVK